MLRPRRQKNDFTVWLSTLERLASEIANNDEFKQEFERLNEIISNPVQDPDVLKSYQQLESLSREEDEEFVEFEPQVKLSAGEKEWLDSLIIKLTYPSNEICQCTYQNPNCFYHRENYYFFDLINKNEDCLEEVIEIPFRQSRNAYGFSGTAFSGMGIILTFVPPLGLGLTCGLLTALPLAVGGYLYYRGRREGKLTSAHNQADFFEAKVNLLFKHKDTVRIRQECEIKEMPRGSQSESQSHQQVLTQSPSLAKPQRRKPPKVKRTDGGNPYGHFFAVATPTFTTLGLFAKFGIFAAILGGPIGLGIAGGFAVCAGLFFAYKRYKETKRDLKFQRAMGILSARDTQLNEIQTAAKQGRILSLIPTNSPKTSLVTQERSQTSRLARMHKAINEKPANEPRLGAASTTEETKNLLDSERDDRAFASNALSRQTAIKSECTANHSDPVPSFSPRKRLLAQAV